METDDLIIDKETLAQIHAEQMSGILEAYSSMREELSQRYSPEFVEQHPEVAASLTVAMELKSLAYLMGEYIEDHKSGLIADAHYLNV